MKIFSLDSGRSFAERVAAELGVPLSAHEERDFEDGEYKVRPLENVRGSDVVVVQSLYGDDAFSADQKLCRLLIFIGALKDASARQVTAVVPYLCFARKDRKTKPRDPVATRIVACLFEAAGCDRVVTLDVHNLAAFQNAFRCRTDHLEAAKLFAAEALALLKGAPPVVVSPDIGGVKRAERFREIVEKTAKASVPMAFMEKMRSGGVVSGETLIGDVSGKAAIIIDDLIASGTTVVRAARACRAGGAQAVYAAATHGLFVGGAGQLIAEPAVDKILVTDSVPPFRLPPAAIEDKVRLIESAPLIAEAIKRIHSGGSIVELLEP